LIPLEGKFTERAKRVLTIAHEEAERAGSPAIESEHLLLGLLRDETATQLGRCIISMSTCPRFELRWAVLPWLCAPTASGFQPALSSERLEQVLRLSADEARSGQGLGPSYLGTEHLLLGLLDEGGGLARKYSNN